MKSLHTKAIAFTKTALVAAAFALVGANGLHADDIINGVKEFKEGKELDGEERLRIPRGGALRFIGDKTTVTRAIEPAKNGRRGHGDGDIIVVKPDAVLTLTSVHGNNEPGVYRRTHKKGPGTLVIAGDEDNDGAKFVVWEGKLIFAKASDGGTHAQGSNGFLEIYSTPSKDVEAGKPDVVGILELGGTGDDQIADEAAVLVGGPHSDRGGILDLNTRKETIGSLSLGNGTIRWAFGGAVGKTGTLTVESEHAIGIGGKNTFEFTDGAKWLPGDYTLIKASEEIPEAYTQVAIKGISNAKLELSANKKSLILKVAGK